MKITIADLKIEIKRLIRQVDFCQNISEVEDLLKKVQHIQDAIQEVLKTINITVDGGEKQLTMLEFLKEIRAKQKLKKTLMPIKFTSGMGAAELERKKKIETLIGEIDKGILLYKKFIYSHEFEVSIEDSTGT